MTAAIGVLCARSRIEEKQLIAALAEAGAPAMLLDPTCPLPFTPPPGSPGRPGMPGRLITPDTSMTSVLVDRCQDRALASAVLPVWRGLGATVLSAGVAATGSRAVIAATLSASGLPRPEAFLATDDDAAMATLVGLGFPATLLPLATDEPAVTLHDQDTAEAVFEHRGVLGGVSERVAVIQAGVPAAGDTTTVLVVGGVAVAATDASWVAVEPDIAPLAIATARALNADIVGVTLAMIDGEIVIWDVQPVPEFREMSALGATSAADAIARLASVTLAPVSSEEDVPVEIVAVASDPNLWREVTGGVALTA